MRSLFDPVHFIRRADAIEWIDFYILDRIGGDPVGGDQPGGLPGDQPRDEKLAIIRRYAAEVKHALEEVDTDLFTHLRSRTYTRGSFREMLRTYLADYSSEPDGIGYDHLDVFVSRLLSAQPLPEATLAGVPDMVFYQKTPARIVFEMAGSAGFTRDDVFFDIGSGLGQVVILIHLISGVTARGVEYEPAYCDYARACAARLNLSGVGFIHAYAGEADYATGTVFFLYTPFEGRMLQDMLDILRYIARDRAIRVFTYGPCSPHVARQDWLRCIRGSGEDFYTLYQFASI